MDQAALAREIGQASVDETQWPGVVNALSTHVGADGAYLFTAVEQAGPRSFDHTHRLAPEFNRRYREHFHACDVYLAAARARGLLDAGGVLNSEDLVKPDDLLRSEFHNDYLKGFDVRYGLGAILTDEQDEALGPRTHLVFWRPPGAETFGDDEERKLAALLPTLRLALTSHWALRSKGLLGEWNEQLLAQIDQPFFLLSRGGQMLYGNQAALNLLRERDAVSVKDGLLCRGKLDVPLIAQFDLLTAVPVDLAGGASTGPAMKIVPLKLTANTRSMFHWFPRAAYVVLPQVTAGRREEGIEQAFVRRYGLTAAEQLVLTRLLQGMSPRDVAADQKLSVHTVRAHLAHIYAKTGCHNQRELLAAILRARSA